jgi:hypothetical protein
LHAARVEGRGWGEVGEGENGRICPEGGKWGVEEGGREHGGGQGGVGSSGRGREDAEEEEGNKSGGQ